MSAKIFKTMSHPNNKYYRGGSDHSLARRTPSENKFRHQQNLTGEPSDFDACSYNSHRRVCIRNPKGETSHNRSPSKINRPPSSVHKKSYHPPGRKSRGLPFTKSPTKYENYESSSYEHISETHYHSDETRQKTHSSQVSDSFVPKNQRKQEDSEDNEDLESVEDLAATKIQAAFRGHKVRKDLQEEKPDDDAVRESAATMIQAAYRGHLVRSNLPHLIQSQHDEEFQTYNSTMDALEGASERDARYKVDVLEDSIEDVYRKRNLISIQQWPPVVNPNSSSSKVNLSLGMTTPGYLVLPAPNNRTQIKRYHELEPRNDPHLGILGHLDELYKRTKKALGLRRLEPTPGYALDLRVAECVQDDSIPVVVIIGGIEPRDPLKYQNGKVVLKYHPLKDRFEHIGMMLEPRNNHAAAFLNDCIYVTGGLDPDKRNNGEMVATRTTFCLRLKTFEWTRKAMMLCSRAFHSLMPFKGKLYALGGRDHTGRLVASLETYDPAADQWTLLRPMQMPRMGIACVFFEGEIWCMGGIGSGVENAEDPVQIVTNVSSYNPIQQKWMERPPLRCPRAFATGVVVDKAMWICGGCGRVKGQRFLVSMGSIDRFNASAGIWERKTLISNPRHCAGVTAVENCIYIFGGMSSQEWSAQKRNEMIITTDRSIHNCKDLPVPLSGLTAVTIPPYSPSLRPYSLACLFHDRLTN